jgi:hypothetical protein
MYIGIGRWIPPVVSTCACARLSGGVGLGLSSEIWRSTINYFCSIRHCKSHQYVWKSALKHSDPFTINFLGRIHNMIKTNFIQEFRRKRVINSYPKRRRLHFRYNSDGPSGSNVKREQKSVSSNMSYRKLQSWRRKAKPVFKFSYPFQ